MVYPWLCLSLWLLAVLSGELLMLIPKIWLHFGKTFTAVFLCYMTSGYIQERDFDAEKGHELASIES